MSVSVRYSGVKSKNHPEGTLTKKMFSNSKLDMTFYTIIANNDDSESYRVRTNNANMDIKNNSENILQEFKSTWNANKSFSGKPELVSAALTQMTLHPQKGLRKRVIAHLYM